MVLPMGLHGMCPEDVSSLEEKWAELRLSLDDVKVKEEGSGSGSGKAVPVQGCSLETQSAAADESGGLEDAGGSEDAAAVEGDGAKRRDGRGHPKPCIAWTSGILILRQVE